MSAARLADVDRTTALVQRSLDGELGLAEHDGLRRLLADDAAAAAQARRLEALHVRLQAALPAATTADRERVAAIVARLPATIPSRHRHLRLVDILVASSAVPLLVVFYGLAGTLRDLVNLTLVALLSVALGVVLIALAGALRDDIGTLARLLRRQVGLGPVDVLAYRVTGAALVVGGIVSWFSAG